MKSLGKQKTFYEILNYLPENISKMLYNLPIKTIEDISEIRLRSERPLSLTIKGQNLFISNSGNICFLMQNGLYNVTKQDIDYTFKKMCNHSVYAYTNEIRAGFITLKNGCRAGIAASAVYENGKLSNFNNISSINIRIAGEYIGCADCLLPHIKGGIIVAGPPSSGKTTLLRDLVRSVSYGKNTACKRVAVVDSRGEIAASKDGVLQNDLGPLTDVISGTEKQEGVLIALRTLSPEVICFDEISTESEADTVLEGVFAGADVFTSVHAGSVEELVKRKAALKLISTGAVKNAVFISGIGAEPVVVDLKELVV